MASLVKDKAELDMLVTGAMKKLVVVDFFANWCGPCNVCAPKLNVLADEFSEHIVVLKVNVDQNEDIAEDFNVTSMPTFIMIKEGEVVDTIIGANMHKLRKSVEKHIAESGVDVPVAASVEQENPNTEEEQQQQEQQNSSILFAGQGEIAGQVEAQDQEN